MLACALFIWLPENTALDLGIADFRKNYGGWVGASFLLFVSIWLVASALFAKNWISARRNAAAKEEAIEAALATLSPEERAILRLGLDAKKTTVYLAPGAAGAAALVAKGLLVPVSLTPGQRYWKVPYLIPVDVWSKIVESKSILEETRPAQGH
jgi:hypothetical protein